VSTVCDLTRDDTARGLLAAWLRRPYDAVIQAVIADRAGELGFAEGAAQIRGLYCGPAWREVSRWPRRRRQRMIRYWRGVLVEFYGDPAPPSETNTLPGEVPADTPLPF
jgi:hypothetical protein